MRDSARVIIFTVAAMLFVSEIAVFVTTVSATRYVVGEIKKGDWALFTYDYNYTVGNWTVDPSDPNKPGELIEVIAQGRQQGHINATVKSILGKYVTLSLTRYLENATTTEKLHGNLETGEGNLTFYVIAGNLEAEDLTWNSNQAPKIDWSKLWFTAGANREANGAEFEEVDPFGESYSAFQLCWDKRTGFICEMNVLSQEGEPLTEEILRLTTVSTNLKMIETSLWDPGEEPTTVWSGTMTVALIIIIAIIGLLVIVFLIKR